MANCPKCEKPVLSVVLNEIAIGIPRRYLGVGYSCPRCDTLISVQMDPIALKTDIVNETAEKLRSGDRPAGLQ